MGLTDAQSLELQRLFAAADELAVEAKAYAEESMEAIDSQFAEIERMASEALAQYPLL